MSIIKIECTPENLKALSKVSFLAEKVLGFESILKENVEEPIIVIDPKEVDSYIMIGDDIIHYSECGKSISKLKRCRVCGDIAAEGGHVKNYDGMSVCSNCARKILNGSK